MALPNGAVGWSIVCDCVFFPDHTHLFFITTLRYFAVGAMVTRNVNLSIRIKLRNAATIITTPGLVHMAITNL